MRLYVLLTVIMSLAVAQDDIEIKEMKRCSERVFLKRWANSKASILALLEQRIAR